MATEEVEIDTDNLGFRLAVAIRRTGLRAAAWAARLLDPPPDGA
jgi:hypothetical protein